ncbi:hypothetical protein ACFU8W_46175 [Streptomyces sp. NPDC057565]|uniref:hypothetical protein n=1 Tax=Streptomyces sp. NPDC057565 TaxID=3346169 RepID=UPI00367E697E
MLTADTDNPDTGTPALDPQRRQPREVLLDGYVHGYRIAFIAGAVLFTLTLAALRLLIRSRRTAAAQTA